MSAIGRCVSGGMMHRNNREQLKQIQLAWGHMHLDLEDFATRVVTEPRTECLSFQIAAESSDQVWFVLVFVFSIALFTYIKAASPSEASSLTLQIHHNNASLRQKK